VTDAAAIIAPIQEALPGVNLEGAPSVDLQTTVYVQREDVPRIAQTLRDRPELAFTLLADLTAVDFWPREPRFEVVYMLVSPRHRLRLRMKVRLHGTDPRLATVCTIWPAANWLEREVWDLFGIAFDGHPDPRRLLMPEDWEGHPLRRDYPIQIRLPVRASSALQVSEEEFRANVEKDRLTRSPRS
jgi:NADH-quinone oxidoreductase subunit C